MQKIIGILVMMLLIATTVLPVFGQDIDMKENKINNTIMLNAQADVPVWEVGDSWTYNEKYCAIGSNYAWFHNCTMVCTVIDDTGDSYTLEWVSENDEGSYTIEGYFRLKFTPYTRFIQETKHRKTDLAHESTNWQEKGPVIWLIGNLNFPLPAQFSDVMEETYSPADETFSFPITAGSSGTFPEYSYNGHQKVGLYWGLIKIVDSDYSGNILTREYNCEMANIAVPAGTYEAYNISIEGNFYENQEYYRTTWTYYVPQLGYVAKQFHHLNYVSSGQYFYKYTNELVSTTYTQ
jgi:hypothetical protein